MFALQQWFTRKRHDVKSTFPVVMFSEVSLGFAVVPDKLTVAHCTGGVAVRIQTDEENNGGRDTVNYNVCRFVVVSV